MKFLLIHPEDVPDDLIGYCLLLHDKRILRVGVEVEVFRLEAFHVLGCEDDAQSFVAPHGDEIAERTIVEVEHVVRLITMTSILSPTEQPILV